MSQSAVWTIPQSGPSTPTNQAGTQQENFDAILSGQIGTSRPPYAVQGTRWAKDTGVSPAVIQIYEFDGTNDILIATYDVLTSKISFKSFKGDNVASASSITVPINGDYFDLTGAVTIATVTIAANRQVTFKSISGLTLTQSAGIVTLDGSDLVLAAGETVTLQSTAANVVQVVSVGSVSSAAGGWIPDGSATAAASTDIQFTDHIEGFDYLYEITGLTGTSDGAQLEAELGIAGPTYRVTGYHGMNGFVQSTSSAAATLLSTMIALDGASHGNAADEDGVYSLTIFNPAAATDTHFLGVAGWQNTGTAERVGTIAGHHGTAEAMVAIKFAMSASTIAAGLIQRYKRARS